MSKKNSALGPHVQACGEDFAWSGRQLWADSPAKFVPERTQEDVNSRDGLPARREASCRVVVKSLRQWVSAEVYLE